jgi:hypothetical protein
MQLDYFPEGYGLSNNNTSRETKVKMGEIYDAYVSRFWFTCELVCDDVFLKGTWILTFREKDETKQRDDVKYLYYS